MMKNDLKKSLNRELRGVHVSSRLRARILSEARERRFRAQKRVRILRALASAAAVLLVFAIFAGMIFLRQGRPGTPDTVLTPGQGGSVWVGDGDGLYHARRDCGGSHRERVMTLAEAKASGLTACPQCIHNPSPTAAATAQSTLEPIMPSPTAAPTSLPTVEPTEQAPEVDELPLDEPMQNASSVVTVDGASVHDADYTMVWTSENDEFYHLSQDCSPDADEYLMEITCCKMGKEACRKCFSSPDIWMTPGGTYFHEARNCSGMENAQVYLRSYAVAVGKAPCPICLGQRPVWVERGGKIYHTSNHFSGKADAREISEWEAILSGFTVCDQCFPEFWDIEEPPSAEVQVTVAGPMVAIQLTGDCQTEYIEQGNTKYGFRDSETTLPFMSDSFWMQDVLRDKLMNDEICGLYAIGYSLRDVVAENDGEQFSLPQAASFSNFYGDRIRCLYLFPVEKTPDRLRVGLSANAYMETVDMGGMVHSASNDLSLDGANITLSGDFDSGDVMTGSDPLILCENLKPSKVSFSDATLEKVTLSAERVALDDFQVVTFVQYGPSIPQDAGPNAEWNVELKDTILFYDENDTLLTSQVSDEYSADKLSFLLPKTEGPLTAIFTQSGETQMLTLE